MAMFLLLIMTHKISHGAWLQKGNENLNMCISEDTRPWNIYLPWLWSISAVERSTVFIPLPWSALDHPQPDHVSDFTNFLPPPFHFHPVPLFFSLFQSPVHLEKTIFNSMGTCVHYDIGWIRKLMQVTNQCTLCILKCKQRIDPPVALFQALCGK